MAPSSRKRAATSSIVPAHAGRDRHDGLDGRQRDLGHAAVYIAQEARGWQPPDSPRHFRVRQRRGTVHQGMDIAADMKVPVYAAAEGEAIYVGVQLGGYGNVVILRHDQKTTTLYGHNSALKIKTGQQVKTDQVVAFLGSTGRSTGPHLHFEIRENERPVNPRPYLAQSRF